MFRYLRVNVALRRDGNRTGDVDQRMKEVDERFKRMSLGYSFRQVLGKIIVPVLGTVHSAFIL